MITIGIKTLSQIEFKIVDTEPNAYFSGDQVQTVKLKHRKEGKEHIITFAITNELINRKINKKAIIKTSASFAIESKDNRIIENPNNQTAIEIFSELTQVCSSHARAFFKQSAKGTDFESYIIPYRPTAELMKEVAGIIRIGYSI
jgi:hypothetical protein